MATTKYRGTGAIASTDVKEVRWEGLTKGGKYVKIEMPKALNMGNIDWTFAEKDDVVAEVVFTALYSNTNAMATTTTEPFTIEIEDGVTAGASEIIIGAGALYIDDVKVALTRGGGSFNVEREYRNINADGDRGPVDGRVVIDSSTATLTINTLQILTRLTDLYSGIEQVTA